MGYGLVESFRAHDQMIAVAMNDRAMQTMLNAVATGFVHPEMICTTINDVQKAPSSSRITRGARRCAVVISARRLRGALIGAHYATPAQTQARVGHSTSTAAMRYKHAAQNRDAEVVAQMHA